MDILLTLFGWPHELLHLLALRLVGRAPLAITKTHIDIPDDLTKAQYVFVAGLPALVFWPIFAACAIGFLLASEMLLTALWFALASFAALPALGTVGDLLGIYERLRTPDAPHT